MAIPLAFCRIIMAVKPAWNCARMCDTVLEPGMVVSMEPMIMIPEGQPGAGGYREHDIFIVTEDGAENITNFPYGPEEMIIRKTDPEGLWCSVCPGRKHGGAVCSVPPFVHRVAVSILSGPHCCRE